MYNFNVYINYDLNGHEHYVQVQGGVLTKNSGRSL